MGFSRAWERVLRLAIESLESSGGGGDFSDSVSDRTPAVRSSGS